ncbi:TonB-dependent receptor, partial [Steroidobacter sp.]|uniref:TonB-dependent receptor n=1 Tax=Steroidobacter sp. TaxID=1978227 RepID=UPI001A55FE18
MRSIVSTTLRSLFIATTVLSAAVATAPIALAANQLDENVSFHIQAQSLENALFEFSKQSDCQILFSSESLLDKQAPAISGKMQIKQALSLLLSGTELGFRLVGNRTISVGVGVGADASTDMSAGNGKIRLAQAEATQSTAQRPSEAPDRGIEEVVVTGSNIRMNAAADMGALPVQVISAQKFQQTAGESIADLLRSQPIVSGFNTTPANDEYNGGNTSINLRGIGDQYTLVLVNGRRFGGEDVPDIGAIPTEAIESVEILKNGASAIFGSDAVAGVVNIKLKNNIRGLEFVSSYGNTTDHDASFRRAGMLFGTELSGLRLSGSLSWQDRNGIERQDREISASRDFRRFGGIDRRSRTALIPSRIRLPNNTFRSIDVSRFGPGQSSLNPADFVTPSVDQGWSGNEIGTFPPYQRLSGHWLAEYDIVDQRLTVFSEGYYDRRDQRFKYVAPQIIVDVPAANVYNPFGQDVSVYYQFGGNELAPLYSDYDTRNLQGSFGVRGDLGEYRYEVAYTRYRKTVDSKNYNDVVYESAQAAVERPGADALNVFGYWANSGAQLAGLTAVSGLHVGNEVTTLEGKVSGPLFRLPTGSVDFAAGAAHRKVDYSYVPDETWRTVETYWSGLNTEIKHGEREIDSVYAELRVPLLSPSSTGPINALELGGAVRYEEYSDFGNATVGQVNTRLAMFDESLILRASFAEAFKAPSVDNLTAPQLTSQLNGLVDPFFGGVAPIYVVEGGNPGLKPEQADTYNFGVVYSLRSAGLTLKADYWRIDLTDLIDFPSVQSVLFGTSPNGSLTRDPITNVATVDSRIDNGGDRRVRGIDIGTSYTVRTDHAGQFAFDLNATRILEFKTILGSVVDDHLTGTSLGVVPKWRSVLGAYWNKAGWETAFFLHYSEGV